MMQSTGTDSFAQAPRPVLADTLEVALRESVAAKPGVASVRVLPRSARHGAANHKVFVVLHTHDIDRDREVIELLVQFDGIDYDLVPETAAGMIPDAARPV